MYRIWQRLAGEALASLNVLTSIDCPLKRFLLFFKITRLRVVLTLCVFLNTCYIVLFCFIPLIYGQAIDCFYSQSMVWRQEIGNYMLSIKAFPGLCKTLWLKPS